ncbi:MAG: AAA family ATPase [Gaiellales bacterium]
MATAAPSSGNTGRRLLVEWANDQDHWVRGLVAEALSSRRPLTEDAVEHFYELLLREKELAPGEVPSVEKLEDAAGGVPTEEPLALTRISDVENVNALARKQEIDFNPGLTVLFGENGAGKTGYVRVLKTAASVRNAEPILPNVRKQDAGPPSASISYRLGPNHETHAWRGEQGVRPLTRIDVFDSGGLLLHVDEELTYVYTPGDVALFRIVHDAIEAVRRQLEKDRDARRPQGNPFLPRFSREAPLYSKIEALGPSTNLGELQKLAEVSAEEEKQLLALRETVEALRGKASTDRLQLVRDELALYRRVKDALDAVERFPATEYVEAVSGRDEALRRHREVGEERLRAASVPGVLEQPWRELVEAAERYIRETEHEHYPRDGDACVYCRQPLAAAARQLLAKYRAYCNNAHQKNAAAAERAARQLAQELVDLDAPHLDQDLTRRRDQLAPGDVPIVLTSALAFLKDAAALKAHLGALKFPAEAVRSPRSAADLRRPLEDHLRQAAELETTHTGELAEREKKLQQELPRLRMLKARLTLRELMPQVQRHVEEAQWADRAGRVLKRFQGMLKSLTDSSKVASEQLLNQDFEARFHEECQRLKAPAVTLEFPGRRGEPARRKSLAPRHRLSAILSEGEQKVIALADFLAESMLRRSASPVVLDDPVTSLDYKRLSYVVGRIVELSGERQVIVFTHNIWFTMELLARFEEDKDQCSYYDVSEDGDARGFVARARSPRLDSWGDKKKRINALIDRVKKETQKEVRDALIEKAYEDLRGACEIVVEQDLLQRVVQSYAPNVMVAKLRDIKVSQLQGAIEKLTDVHDRCCRFIGSHKQPLETLNVRPTLEKLEEDWGTLQEVRRATLTGGRA